MALLNRFSRLNDRGETGVFTFIVTKSVTRDFHRDATTKDFCFGYHRWAISFQRPAERVLGVHLLLRNPSPNTSCVVDFSLALLSRDHFSRNQVYAKRQAKFTITNPMQGVSRWIQVTELNERRFSNETGEFLFELSLSNMRTIFECDIQLNPNTLTHYKSMLKCSATRPVGQAASPSQPPSDTSSASQQQRKTSDQLINLETNCFTFGSFDWSLTIVPLVVASGRQFGPSSAMSQHQQVAPPIQPSATDHNSSASSSSSNLLTPNKQQSSSNHSIASSVSSLGARDRRHHHAHQSAQQQPHQSQRSSPDQSLEPVCRVYLNRLSGFDSLCRVRYRVILGHHQQQQQGASVGAGAHSAEFVDSQTLDQISDSAGRIRGHQFRNTNILKLIALRSAPTASSAAAAAAATAQPTGAGHHPARHAHQHHQQGGGSASLDLRVHIEMFCANTVSEARVVLHRNPNESQQSNCSDRNKQSVPRNHLRYISWSAYVVRRDPRAGGQRESLAVRHSPHSNYYLQDGIDLGTIMDTDIPVKEIQAAPQSYLDSGALMVHVEWIDSLLLFSHLYSNYDSLATVQRHQISRELDAVQLELETLEEKYEELCKTLSRMQLESGRVGVGAASDSSPASSSPLATAGAAQSPAGPKALAALAPPADVRPPPVDAPSLGQWISANVAYSRDPMSSAPPADASLVLAPATPSAATGFRRRQPVPPPPPPHSSYVERVDSVTPTANPLAASAELLPAELLPAELEAELGELTLEPPAAGSLQSQSQLSQRRRRRRLPEPIRAEVEGANPIDRQAQAPSADLYYEPTHLAERAKQPLGPLEFLGSSPGGYLARANGASAAELMLLDSRPLISAAHQRESSSLSSSPPPPPHSAAIELEPLRPPLRRAELHFGRPEVVAHLPAARALSSSMFARVAPDGRVMGADPAQRLVHLCDYETGDQLGRLSLDYGVGRAGNAPTPAPVAANNSYSMESALDADYLSGDGLNFGLERHHQHQRQHQHQQQQAQAQQHYGPTI